MTARSGVFTAAFLLAAAVLSAQAPLYWESPTLLDANGMRWSSSGTGGGRMVLAWEDIVPTPGKNEGMIYLSAADSPDGITWNYTRRFAGPLKYSGVDPGQEPQVYSMVVAPDGRVFVAVATAEKEITIYGAEKGLAFQVLARLTTPLTSVTPSLFMTGGGSLLLFTTTAPAGADAANPNQAPLTLAWSYSSDGRAWSPIGPFVTDGEAANGILLQPDHVTSGGREIVAFQSERLAGAGSDVYLKTSVDGGRTWGAAQAVTSLSVFQETVAGVNHPPTEFTNERPRLFSSAAGVSLVWERRLLGSPTASLYSVGLDASGAAAGTPESLTPGVSSIFAQLISLGPRTLLLYAQNSAGAWRIVLSEKTGAGWSPTVLGRTLGGSSEFPHADVLNGSLFVFWENGPVTPAAAGGTTLVELRPKKSVAPPELVAVGFTPGKPEKADSATIRWRQQDDSVGIDEYQVRLLLNGTVVPPVHVVTAGNTPTETFPWTFSADGTWRFEVVAIDLAQNRSPPATIDFVRDTTPPGAVVLVPPAAGADGFLPANSFTVSWTGPSDPDVAGYTWEEQAVGATLADYQQGKPVLRAPPARVMTTHTVLPFDNLDNGVHVVSVAAVDAAGNIGPVSSIVVQLDKFAPFTAIYALLRSVDTQGNVAVAVRGKGFLTNGTLDEIYLSRSPSPPYDRVIKPGQGGFTVVSDSLITGLVLDNSYASGTYRIGLHQQSRPAWFWQGGSLTFESPGTVRFGNFSVPVPRWLAGTTPRVDVSFNSLLVVAVVALLAVLLVFSIGRLAALAQEGAVLRGEIVALLEGQPSAGTRERNLRMQELKRRGIGLRVKFTLLMVVLVTLIVLIVSIPLSVQMISSSARSLATELQKRTNILISTIAASAQVEIQKGPTGPASGQVGIIAVPDNKSQMAEAVYVTITGAAAVGTDTISRDYVWASNADTWEKKKKDNTFEFAAEVENDRLTPRVTALQASVNAAGLAGAADLVSKLQATRDRAAVLSARATSLTTAERQELAAALKTSQDTLAQINVTAKDLPESGVGSLPPYDPADVRGSYLFYKPIVYYQPGDKTFYQGLVRMEVDTAAITEQILRSRDELIRTTLLIALIAIGLGVLGAIILANITVTPIRRLAQGVAVIRDTQDQEQLKDHVIQVRTRDEIGSLAETVNEMTQGLVRAAIANKELMLGKDVQKMFLPLEKDRLGKKGSTAEADTKDVEIYGYYEGAAEVSGDYFDFRQLDATHYALIKCDVSGHGVSAGLIMVEVATLFISYFRDWQRRKESLSQIKDPGERKRLLLDLERLDTLVYTINDMLEERGFKGLFAGFTICLFNTDTGRVTACPAGDRDLHIYDVSERRMVHSTFTKGEGSPAAGVFPSMLVEMKSGFPQFPFSLEHGDVLFLPTDGIDEAKRFLRNASFEVITCQEPGLKEGDYHLNTHKWGTDNEDFGRERMDEFIDGVFNKARVRLVRHHNPIPNEELEFDFSGCGGSVKEAVLAVVSAEKVFRLVLTPTAGDGSRVKVDAKIDAFLKEHFIQYERYFAHRLEGQPDDPYVHFSHLEEDEQKDDLTILVIRRK